MLETAVRLATQLDTLSGSTPSAGPSLNISCARWAWTGHRERRRPPRDPHPPRAAGPDRCPGGARSTPSPTRQCSLRSSCREPATSPIGRRNPAFAPACGADGLTWDASAPDGRDRRMRRLGPGGQLRLLRLNPGPYIDVGTAAETCCSRHTVSGWGPDRSPPSAAWPSPRSSTCRWSASRVDHLSRPCGHRTAACHTTPGRTQVGRPHPVGAWLNPLRYSPPRLELRTSRGTCRPGRS